MLKVALFLLVTMVSFSFAVSPGDHFEMGGMKFQIERNYTLDPTLSQRYLHRIVQSVVNESNPDHVGLSAEEATQLSRHVVQTAQCYGIDPLVFANLISRESNFKPNAISDRGAVGLTQMTQAGIAEVLDRLDPHSKRRLNHLRALIKKCDPQIYDELPTVIAGDTIAEWKSAALTSPSYSLVLGALLLKLNLANHRLETKKLEIYRMALERYNGDPRVKIQFARDVLRGVKRMRAGQEIVSSSPKSPPPTP